jgi:hypothetical protein
MRKHLIRVLTMFGFLMGMTAATAFAQERPPLKVNIPFDFSVANRTLPAGEYTVTERNSVGQAIIVRNDSGSAAVCAIGRPLAAKKESEKPMLVFHCYGNQYFLARVVHAGWLDGQELVQTRTERRAMKEQSNRHLAQADANAELVTIVATQQ